MNKVVWCILIGCIASCASESNDTQIASAENQLHEVNETSVIVLGNIQDAGSPHIGCEKQCCSQLFDSITDRRVVALGLYDAETDRRYLFEATPDIAKQLKSLNQFGPPSDEEIPNGIFLTHAHIGHYTGLMYLGKEAINASNVPVYTMPKMEEFLRTNGPWSQLVTLNNIAIQKLANEQEQVLSSQLKVIPFSVPHRDEYSETVGYKIIGPDKSFLFIPDIDKWDRWERSIVEEIKTVDYAFLDATFYSGAEINNRDISQIPHPFVIESFETFKNMKKEDRNKIYFIHFNHTNPIIDPDSPESKEIINKGFNIARQGDVFKL